MWSGLFSCCHKFWANGITAYLENGGIPEHAQVIFPTSLSKTTKLYDCTSDQMILDEVKRKRI